MNTIQASGVVLVALVWHSAGIAQERDAEAILVSASRAEEPLVADDYAGSATTLSARDLQLRQTRDIADVLRDVPGVAVSAVAGQTQLRLRGSEGNHVLVLVDGIEVSDPFAGEFDMGTLQAEIGASVEVLRGPQSALYGSDAIGGVIAYQSSEFNGLSAMLEGGSNSTLNASARAGTSGEQWGASLSAVRVSTDGAPNARGGERDLGRDSTTIAGKLRYEPLHGFELRGVARYVLTEGDFNDQDFDSTSPTFGLVVDSPGTRYENEAIYGLAGVRLSTAQGRWTHDLSGQIADIRRDSFTAFGRSFGSKGGRLKGSYVTALSLGGPDLSHSFTFAADWERETFRNTDPFGFAFTGKRSARNMGLAGEYRAKGERFDLSAAIRRDFNNRFADATTFRLGAGFAATPTTRLHAAWGTGIKNPGFYELYGYVDGRFIGNADLKPEKSESWEVGLRQSLAGDAITLAATWFDARLKDEIFTDYPAPDFIASPANSSGVSKREGLEVSARARLGPEITLDAAYTWLDASEPGGIGEVRRPSNTASAVLTWTTRDDRASAALITRYNGAADDLAFTDPSFVPVRVTLEDYTLVGFNARYALSDRVDLFGRVENLLDETFEQVFSFVSQGRSVIAGIRVSL